MSPNKRTMTYGIVVGNRGFFPDHLAKTGREQIISELEAAGARAIVRAVVRADIMQEDANSATGQG